jgi:hypothetical protein
MSYVWIFLFIIIIIIFVVLYLRSFNNKTLTNVEISDLLNTSQVIGKGESVILSTVPFVAAGIIDSSSPKSILRVKDLQKHPRSKSEAAIIQVAENLTGKSFPTVYPSWLVWKGKGLELDGYSDDLKVAIEFSGPLHTKWDQNTESYINYYERVVRDLMKIRLCKKNNVDLIVVDASLPKQHWKNYLLSRFADINIKRKTSLIDTTLPTRDSPTYILEQKIKPYRNKNEERILSLNDYKYAKKLKL